MTDPQALLALKVNGEDLSLDHGSPGADHRARVAGRTSDQVADQVGGTPDVEARVMAIFRRLYGREGPGHLLAMLLTYAITGYVVWAIFQNVKPWTVLLWLGGAIVAHDFVFLPLYTAAYRLARRVGAITER